MFDFPEILVIGRDISKWLDQVVDWVVVSWDPFFSAINIGVLRLLVPFQDFLQWLPWWFVIIIVGILAWRVVSVKFAVVAASLLLVMSFLGLLDLAMITLAIVLTAALLCVVIGLPVGIAAAKNNRFDSILRPVLDSMQTMPSFVYLIPALMLFGLGKVPAIMATVMYAVAPGIRLTNLGIRLVDKELIEAAHAFGTAPRQMLFKVELPLALPTIMAGINQVIMASLAMVVIASMVGAAVIASRAFRAA